MAAEEDLKLEGGEEEAPAGGGKKKLIIIAVLCLLMGAGIGAGVFFFLGGGSSDEAAAAEAAAAEAEAEEVIPPPQYVILKPEFVLSFQTGTRQRFLQASIQVMTRDQAIVDAMALHEPMVRNKVIQVISSQEFESMRTTEGRLKLQEDLKKALSDIMAQEAGSEDIEAVLFTNFVMQ